MPDDNALVREAKAGSYEAFEELVNRHERRTYAIAMNILRHREDAEDAVQTSFLNALEHLGEFREEASFATWLTHITANTALKTLRKHKGLKSVSLDTAGGMDEEGMIPYPEYIADWKDDPAKNLERRELQNILDSAIDELPEKHRVVFVLRDVAGMSVDDTAGQLGISPANVKVRLLRARLALREKLTHIFGDETKRAIRTHLHEGFERGSTSADEILKAYQKEGGSK